MLIKIKRKKIFVIHNYKNVDSLTVMQQKKEQFIINCYEGHEINAPLPVGNKTYQVWSFQDSLTEITHFVLGKETTQDWFKNNPNDPSSDERAQINQQNMNVINVIQYQIVMPPNPHSFLEKLYSSISDVLCALFTTNANLQIVFDLQKDKLYMRSGTTQPMDLTKIINYDGLSIVPGRRSNFIPRHSVNLVDCDGRNGCVITVELPGFIPSGVRSENKISDDQYKSNLDIGHKVSQYEKHLVIKGSRDLYYKAYNAPGENDIKIFNYQYGESHSIIQRSQGPFEIEIKLDPNMDLEHPSYDLSNGILTVFYPPSPLVRPIFQTII